MVRPLEGTRRTVTCGYPNTSALDLCRQALQADNATLVQAGAIWIHINFRLGGFQDWTETSTFGYSALSLYDEVVAIAQRHGLRVVGLLSNEAWRGGLDDWQAGSAEEHGGQGRALPGVGLRRGSGQECDGALLLREPGQEPAGQGDGALAANPAAGAALTAGATVRVSASAAMMAISTRFMAFSRP